MLQIKVSLCVEGRMLEFRGRSKRCDAHEARTATADAFATFGAGRNLREANEATTRVELIDRILEGLGWTAEALARETATMTGDFLDYELWVDRERWCILEAKRSGETFELPSVTPHASTVSLSRLLKTGGRALKDALGQASSYCNDRGVPLACVSNGYQWVFFRGLSAERHPWHEGTALVFRSAEEVLARFDEFYSALARTRAGTHYIFSLLERPAPAAPPVATIPRDLIRTTPPIIDSEKVSRARSVCDYLLADIYGDAKREMLERCYVEPGVSEEFERSIQVLLRDSAIALDVDSEQLVEGDTTRFADEISRHRLASTREPVLVIGHVGAGKTTFLHRAMHRLRTDRTAITALLDLEGRGRGGTISAKEEEQQVCRELIDKLQNSAGTILKNNGASDAALENSKPYSPKTLRTLFHRELRVEKELCEDLWRADENAWLKRENELLVQVRSDSHVVLTRYLRHLSGLQRDDGSGYPLLLVLDNLDQASDEYQRCMYGLALQIARSTAATLVLCIREDTFARGRDPGGFLTSSTLPFVFHVAAPSFSRVLRQRVKFAEAQAQAGALPPPVRQDGDAVVQVCGVIRTALLTEKSQALEVVACLAAQNIRESLTLSRLLVLGSVSRRGPVQPTAAYALESLFGSGSGALTRRGPLQLFNCFDADPAEPPAHALRTRLLAYLSWAHDQCSDRALLEASTTIASRFAAWGYATSSVIQELGVLISAGQVRPYSESERGPATQIDPLPHRITITAPGYAHLTRLLVIPAYRAAMACTTRWYDRQLSQLFIQKAELAGSSDGPTIGDIAVSSAMPVFESYLRQSVSREDAQLSHGLDGSHWVREVRSRSARLLSLEPVEVPATAIPSLPVPMAADGDQEEQLPLAIARAAPAARLPTLDPECSVNNMRWIPRLLWALEWARIAEMGPISPRQIADILTEYGNQSVPPTNVSRAFRDAKEYNQQRRLWRVVGKRYQIERAGTDLLSGLLRGD